MTNTQQQIKELINKYDNLKIEYNTLEEETTEDIKQLKILLQWFKRYEDYMHKAYTIIDAEASAYADGDKEYKENFNN